MIVKFVFEDDKAAIQFSDLLLGRENTVYDVWHFNSRYKLWMLRYSAEWYHYINSDDLDQMSELLSLVLSVGYSNIQLSMSISK